MNARSLSDWVAAIVCLWLQFKVNDGDDHEKKQ